MANIPELNSEISDSLEALYHDQSFSFDMAQVRANAIQHELVMGQAAINFTFDPKKVWKYCDYLFSESSLLIREGYTGNQSLYSYVRTAAQAFEFLAKFANDDEKEILLINAALCYHISGYHANAQCIARIIEATYLSGKFAPANNLIDDNLTYFFRRSLISFLKRDLSSLRQTTTQALSFIQDVQSDVAVGIAEDRLSVVEVYNLTAHAFLHQFFLEFIHFCRSGDRETLSVATRHVQKAYRYFQKAGDVSFSTITSELRTIIQLFDERSTWSTLSRYAGQFTSNRIWQSYLRYLAFEKSIVELWSSQLKAIRAGVLTTDDSFVVQMPTSAGKTFIAELAMLSVLTQKQDSRCLYIAPFRALVNEVEQKLSETLGAVGYKVSNLMGGFEFDSFQNYLATLSDVLVATPEKVDLFLRIHPEYFEQISIVIVDEGHILDEGITATSEIALGRSLADELGKNGTVGRGVLLELLITRLQQKLTEARFIFLSAVMPESNAADFITWLSQNRTEPLRMGRTDRPTRQTIGKFEWQTDTNGQLEYISLAPLPNGRYPFVPYFVTREQYFTGEYTVLGRPKKRTWPTNTTNKTQSTAMLATRFARTGPVLVFCAQPSDVKNVVNNIITSITYLDLMGRLPNERLELNDNPNLESYQLALEWLGNNHPLTQGLRRGVGLHYGPLPDPVRQAVEFDFRNGNIQILVCTNTLGQGVNMPVKTALIYSLERTYADPTAERGIRMEKLKKRDFWNICGRAGRAGKETEGQIIFVVSSPRDAALLEEYRNENNIEEVDSALYKILQALVERRITQDELLGYLDSYVLALLVEEVVDTSDEAAVQEFLGRSLVGIQATRRQVDLSPLVSAVQRTSNWISENVTDQRVRRVYSTTGLRVGSCITLDEHVANFIVNHPHDELIMAENLSLIVNDEVLRAAFNACRGLPETRVKQSLVADIPDDEFSILLDWVNGNNVGDIRNTHWNRDRSESFSEYISDRIMYKLAWGLNGFLRILAFRLSLSYDDLPLSWQYLPVMVKYGVNNVISCWAGGLGIYSRRTIIDIAKLFTHNQDLLQEGTSFFNFVRWLTNLSNDFIIREFSGTRFEKQRLINVINQITVDDQHMRFTLRQDKILSSYIQGIGYEDRHEVASRITQGDVLSLELDSTNTFDENAIMVFFGSEHVGYVQREIAKIIAREMRTGQQFRAYAKEVLLPTETLGYPSIELSIEEVE